MAEEKKTEAKEASSSNRSERSNDDRQRTRKPRRNFRRYNRYRRRQSVPAYVDWKDVDLLSKFIPERGKIMPRRISGVSAKDQRRLARAIKRARVMALVPYVSD